MQTHNEEEWVLEVDKITHNVDLNERDSKYLNDDIRVLVKKEKEKSWNEALEAIQEEIRKPHIASGIMLDQRDRKWIDLQDLSVLLESLKK